MERNIQLWSVAYNASLIVTITINYTKSVEILKPSLFKNRNSHNFKNLVRKKKKTLLYNFIDDIFTKANKKMYYINKKKKCITKCINNIRLIYLSIFYIRVT